MAHTPSVASHRSHDDADLSPTADVLGEVITVIQDPMQGRVLRQCRGAVILPVGTVVDLADGQIAQVISVRLDVSTPEITRVLIGVLRQHPKASTPF